MDKKRMCKHDRFKEWVTEGWQDMNAKGEGAIKWCERCGTIREKDDWGGSWGRWVLPNPKLAKAK